MLFDFKVVILEGRQIIELKLLYGNFKETERKRQKRPEL